MRISILALGRKHKKKENPQSKKGRKQKRKENPQLKEGEKAETKEERKVPKHFVIPFNFANFGEEVFEEQIVIDGGRVVCVSHFLVRSLFLPAIHC